MVIQVEGKLHAPEWRQKEVNDPQPFKVVDTAVPLFRAFMMQYNPGHTTEIYQKFTEYENEWYT